MYWLPNLPALRSCLLPKVTSLDPRTPHQPEKLQKLSKNDYGFTPSKFWVNRKSDFLCALISVECSWFTGGCSGSGAAGFESASKRARRACAFPAFFSSSEINFCDVRIQRVCENLARILTGQGILRKRIFHGRDRNQSCDHWMVTFPDSGAIL